VVERSDTTGAESAATFIDPGRGRSVLALRRGTATRAGVVSINGHPRSGRIGALNARLIAPTPAGVATECASAMQQ